MHIKLFIEIFDLVRKCLGLESSLVCLFKQLEYFLFQLVVAIHQPLMIKVHLARNSRNKTFLNHLLLRKLTFAEAGAARATILIILVELRHRLTNQHAKLIFLNHIFLGVRVESEFVLLVYHLQIHLFILLLHELLTHQRL